MIAGSVMVVCMIDIYKIFESVIDSETLTKNRTTDFLRTIALLSRFTFSKNKRLLICLNDDQCDAKDRES